MHQLAPKVRRALVGTLLGATDVDGGPTAEQRALLGTVATHLFDLDLDDVDALGPGEAGTALEDPGVRTIAVEGLVTLELTRHPPSEALERRVQQYLDALGADDGYQRLTRDYVHQARDDVAADYQRIAVPAELEPEVVDVTDVALVEQLERLADCPDGSMGRSFHDFYQRHGFPWPVDRRTLVRHDFEHVLAGYEPTPEGEVALQAMLTAATGGAAHCSSLLASLLLFEVGLLSFDDLTPKQGVLARPGAAELFGDALARGARCGTDFSALDHLAMADRDLAEVRAELGIEAPTPGPSTFAV